MMRALVVENLSRDYSGCVLKAVETPQPGPGEVLMRVRAMGVNFPDLLQTRGEYQHKPDLPFIAGSEIAGEVTTLGEGVSGISVGDAVVGAATVGGLSEYATARASALQPKPGGLSFSQAAAFGTAYITAYVSLVRRARIEPGEWLLVHGAAGGVGLAAVDLGMRLGAKVIAASASDEKLAVIRDEYGPPHLLNTSGGFRDKVKEITRGHGADVIYDPVGGEVFDESVRCVAFDGRLLVVGFASGRIPQVSVNMPLIKGFSVVGVRAGEYGRRFPERGVENRRAIWEMADRGELRPRVDREYPLEQWREAFARLDDRQVVGKTVVLPDR